MKALNTLLQQVPGVWLGNERPSGPRPVLSSGHRVLDAVLPGGGWPLGSLTEVLQKHEGQHEWRLLLPAVVQAAQRAQVLLIGAPHWPCLPLLATLGLPSHRLTCVRVDALPQRLWSAEQALRCPDVAALLVWLPNARPEALRRLHLAAQVCCPSGAADTSGPLLVVMRPWEAGQASSPAPLRLSLEGVGSGQQGLSVQILKRPGPPLAQCLALTGDLPVLHLLPSQQPGVASAPSATPLQGHNVHLFPSRHAMDRLRSRPQPRHASGH